MRNSFEYRGNTISYELQYKKIKSMNIRIYPDGRMVVSAPNRMEAKAIEQFLMSKSEWIVNTLAKVEARGLKKSALQLVNHYSDQGRIAYLGQYLNLAIKGGKKGYE